MIILITGPSHSGKTKTAQELTAKYGISTLSLDHLKMGLIRSGLTNLTPASDIQSLTDLVWGVAKEIIKTAIENEQDLIVEGLYIPLNWSDSFNQEYAERIKSFCIVFTEKYIRENFDAILAYENVVEKRTVANDYNQNFALKEHKYFRDLAGKNEFTIIEVDEQFQVEISI